MTYLLFIGAYQILTVLAIALVLPVIALIDLMRNEFTGNNKLMWLLIIIFFNIIGTILYFTLSSRHKINLQHNPPSIDK